jgi:DnaJ-domain-containing protein 1
MSAAGGAAVHALTVRGRRVAELSDPELEAEAALRRNARARAPQLAGHATPSAATTSSRARGAASATNLPPGRLLVRRELEQQLANLELQPGATLDAIREQYFRLRERYDPKKQTSDDKRQVAEALVDRLMRAYDALSAHYEAKGQT